MAMVEGNIQVIDVGEDVYVVKNRGQDDEQILVRYYPKDPDMVKWAMERVSHKIELSEEQTSQIFFWMGYFHAHLGRGI